MARTGKTGRSVGHYIRAPSAKPLERRCRPRQSRSLVERPPVERIAEILEALFVKEPELTKALLEALGRADTATISKLFGAPVPASVMAPPAVAMAATEAAGKKGPVWSKPGASDEWVPEEPVYDREAIWGGPPSPAQVMELVKPVVKN